MNNKQITYIALADTDRTALLALMNHETLRAHLVDHPLFTPETLEIWVSDKTEVSAADGCRVRGILIDDKLAGWCGIQPDDDGFELAIVISSSYWGSGLKVFRDMIGWARELGHKEVLFHLLETRRKYRALEKMAKEVKESERMARWFSTYIIPVDING